ncbi:hypothetical protein KI387_018491, partial [Taxus chinensis]
MEHIGRRIPSLDEGDHQTMIPIDHSVPLDSAESHLAHDTPSVLQIRVATSVPTAGASYPASSATD